MHPPTHCHRTTIPSLYKQFLVFLLTVISFNGMSNTIVVEANGGLGRWVNETFGSTKLNNVFNLRKSSQQQPLYNDDTFTADIVGGTGVTTSTATFPFYGYTRRGNLCGVTLIHTDIAITAGHCAGIFVSSGLYMGGIQLNGRDAQENITVLQELRHPNFNSVTLENDILILKLQRSRSSSASATLTTAQTTLPAVTPIYAMNFNSNQPRDNATVVAIGFGATVEDGSLASTLQKVSVRVINTNLCRQMYKKGGSTALVANSMICAASTGKDACQGDSGGPLLIQTTDSQQKKHWKLIGIVSWGIGCARKNNPGVYTRLSSHATFIKSSICTLSQNKPSYCTSQVKQASTTESTPSTTKSPCAESAACTGGYYMFRQQSGDECTSKCITRQYNYWRIFGYQCGRCP